MTKHIWRCLLIGCLAAVAVMFGVMAWNHQWHTVPVVIGLLFGLLTFSVFFPEDHNE